MIPSIHITTGLFRALKDKHGEAFARTVASFGPTQGAGNSKLDRMYSYYQRIAAPAAESDKPDSWQI